MAIHHRTPTIFSIYMVDVLCCALGCVILLWQLYHAESEEQTAAARDALNKLAEAKVDLTNITSDRDAISSERDRLQSELAAADKFKVQVTLELKALRGKVEEGDQLVIVLEKELNKLRAAHKLAEALLVDSKMSYADLLSKLDKKNLELKSIISERDKADKLAIVTKNELDELRAAYKVTEALLTGLKIDYAELLKKSGASATDLAAKIKAYAELMTQKGDLEKRLARIESELNLKMVELKFATDKADLSAKKLDDAAVRAKRLEKLLADLESVGKENLAKLSVSDLRVKLLEQQLELSKKEAALAGKRIEDLALLAELLKGKALASAKDLAIFKEAAANRFEGVTLTGKNVIFIIDTSGSMGLRRKGVVDKEKWPKVIETIERVARSLAEAENLQVIIFSDTASYLHGEDSGWLKYDRATSPALLSRSLNAILPEGGTNLYAAFEKAFALRRPAPDTIYVFSDGLPTEGPGISGDTTKLDETVVSDKLAQHLRQRLLTTWNPPGKGPRVRINSVGFFFESPDVGAFLWALSRENDGSFVGMSRP